MRSILAWLLELPMLVVRLVRALAGAFVRVRRADPRARAVAILRRQYPDAPDVWLELVARNGATAGEPEPGPAMTESTPSDEGGDTPQTHPPATPRWSEARVASERGGAPWTRSRPVVAEAGHMAPELPAKRRVVPGWRPAEAAAPVLPAPAMPGGRPSIRPQYQPVTAIAPMPTRFPAREEQPADSPKFLDLPVEREVAVFKSESSSADTAESDQWPELPTNTVTRDPSPAAAPSTGAHQRWRDRPGGDLWPPLLPATPARPAPRSTTLPERLARLRAIQERR